MDVHVRDLKPADHDALEQLLHRVGVFETHEIKVAMELVAGALGPAGDYLIHVAEASGASHDAGGAPPVIGYICHGHNPVTDAIYDVYWIAVDPRMQSRGVGHRLLTFTEDRVGALNGRGVVIETSSRDEYAAARRLYERCGYKKVAEIADFYKPGDNQLIYMKFVASQRKAS
jgi:ribosomal protein S18 acetylase RimI-like enzyme